MEIDPKTLDDLREMGPRDAYDKVRLAIYQMPGGVSSDDFQSALELLVEAGILSWEEIERFERP